MQGQELGYIVYSETWYNFGNINDEKIDQLFEQARIAPDPEARSKLLKELVAYGTGLFAFVSGPVTVDYNFWSPELKGYPGWRKANGISWGSNWARFWK